MHSKTLGGRPVNLHYASRNAANAAEYSRRFKGAGSFGSYAEALADERRESLE